MKVYEFAAKDAAERESAIDAAAAELRAARIVMAEMSVGHAIAMLWGIVPTAAEARFYVEDSSDAGKYAVVDRITGRSGEVIFDADEDNGDFDFDALTPVEDHLAGAAEADEGVLRRFADDGEYVLRLAERPVLTETYVHVTDIVDGAFDR